MSKDQISEKIKLIESQIQNIKAILKNQANQIGQYHKTLKELTSQLETIKTKLN